MYPTNTLLAIAVLLGVRSTAQLQNGPAPDQRMTVKAAAGTDQALLGSLNSGARSLAPFGFEENKGQVVTTDGQPAPFVRYSLTQGNTHIYLLPNGIAYQFNRTHYPAGYAELKAEALRDMSKQKELEAMREHVSLETFRMDMVLEGADPDARVTTEGRSNDYTNYYTHDALDVHYYTQLTYHEVYPGIDWVIRTTEKGMKYDFVVHPGADPERIKLGFKDHEELYVDAEGNLVHGNRLGRFTEQRPVSFQDGHRVPTRFMLNGDQSSFAVDTYDSSRELIIDPARLWGTYYGGDDYETGYGCSVDASGNSFLAGETSSLNAIATVGGHQEIFGGGEFDTDAFLVKFDPSGVRLWGTYYGGTSSDSGYGCAVTASGFVFLAGNTSSDNGIATSGAYMEIASGSTEAFLVMFDPEGTRLWGTYYVEPFGDFTVGSSCAVDPDGSVVLAGSSGVWLEAQGSMGGGDPFQAFLVKFGLDGTFVWDRYFNGSNYETGSACAVDAGGNCYLAGTTSSIDALTTTGGHQTTNGGGEGDEDAFLVKYDPDGTPLWDTYYGGTTIDRGNSCVVDGDGNVILAGTTYSTNAIATVGAHQSVFGGPEFDRDAFVVKFSPSGIRQWGTYYGGADIDDGYSCTVDAYGDFFLVGSTQSPEAIAFQGHQNTLGSYQDAFMAMFDPAGNRLWGTYYGGGGYQEGYACAVAAGGKTYLAGVTGSEDGIAASGHQNTIGGICGEGCPADAFLVQFAASVDCQGVPNGPATQGTACDDGDVFTTDDIWRFNCVCAGEVSCFDGIPFTLSGTDNETLTGSSAVVSSSRWYAITITECADVTFRLCADAGVTGYSPYLFNTCPADGADAILSTGFDAGTCGGGDSYWEDVPAGLYYFQFSVDQGPFTAEFITEPCSEIVDCLGVTGGTALPGTPCDDNDICTINDVYIGTAPNCECAGTAVPGPTITNATSNSEVCAGNTLLLFSSATGSGTITYSWSGPNGYTSDQQNPTLPAATTAASGPYTVSATNGCGTPDTQIVNVSVFPPPTTATVGVGQTICAGGTTTGLGANTPVVGNGSWSIVSGGDGTFDPDAGTPNATFTHTSGTSPVILRWTISSAWCPASTAEVVITIVQPPTTSTTGGNQTICWLETTAPLGGNAPSIGVGQWVIMAGPGTGTFSDPSDPNATFTHSGGEDPINLVWMITNEPCNASMGGVTISFSPDQDNDGICDLNDNCPNTAGVQGDDCDDLNALTINDVITPSCVCLGTPVSCVVNGDCSDGNACTTDACVANLCVFTPITTDTDGDGIPDCADNCPTVIGQQGSACNDGNPCTLNDVLNASCACAGTADNTDTDGDGIPNCSDNCPNLVGEQGDDCDDLNALTINDVITPTCVCLGTPVSCVVNGDCNDGNACTTDACVANLCVFTPITTDTDGDGIPDCADNCPTVIGQQDSACNDGNPCTLNDVLNASCACAGTADNTDTDGDGIPNCSDNCPNLVGEQGDDCDDLNALTINDVITPSCVCLGTPVSCVVNGDCSDGNACTTDACVANLCVFTPITTDTDGDGIPDCADNCPTVIGQQGSACNDSDPCTINDALNSNCLCAGTSDNTDNDSDGIPNCSDNCPNVPGQVGSPCDDGNPFTVNDALNAVCQCDGPLVSCLVAGDCDDDDPCTADDCVSGNCVYTLISTDTDGDGAPDCADPCPLIPGVPGSACDDGDPCTTNDILDDNCACSGTLDPTDGDGDGIPDSCDPCPAMPAPIGSPCDDADVCTVDDIINNDCTCAGTPILTDTDGDGIPDCSDLCPSVPGTIGSPCDDSDGCTLNDALNNDCQCAGDMIVFGPITGFDSIGGWTSDSYSVPTIPGANYEWLLPINWSSDNSSANSLTAFVQNGPDTVDLCVVITAVACPPDTLCMQVEVSGSSGMPDGTGKDPSWYTVRPNPSTGSFLLTRTDGFTGPVTFTVLDATGRMIAAPSEPAGPRTTALELVDASPGVYFLRISQNEETQVLRLMVRR